MGFRSTIISQDGSGKLPNWFTKKYQDYISFPNGIMVSSKHEAKFYTNDFFEDYQKALIEIGVFDSSFKRTVCLVVLAEDGGVTLVTIAEKHIIYEQSVDFIVRDDVWQGY